MSLLPPSLYSAASPPRSKNASLFSLAWVETGERLDVHATHVDLVAEFAEGLSGRAVVFGIQAACEAREGDGAIRFRVVPALARAQARAVAPQRVPP